MSKNKKSKKKTFIVSETIYISVDIEASSEEEAQEKYELMMCDECERNIIIANSENDINIEEASE